MSYRVDHEIGRGGMAVVFAGHQEELDRPVALKVLAAHLADDPDFRARFLREARIAARLHHPNLVRTFDITEVDGLPCIVMELLPRGTLQGGKLTHEEAAEVAAGLAYAHSRGVVHRDLKPANLLRSGAGEVKIADFGIARAVEETRVTQVGTVLGTLRYLAPEQAEGRDVGPEADVYSLGVVLDELLDPPLPALVERMTAQEPGERPSASEVSELLAPTAATVLTRRSARHWKVPGTVYALGAAVAIVAALILVLTQHHSKPATVEPVPHASTATQEARNLEAWLKRYSG